MTVKLTPLTALFVLLTIFPPVLAQKKNARQKQTPEKEAGADSEKSEAELLVADYRFEEATELIQKEIADARRKRKPTELLERDLRQAQMGENMLRGTEKVVIVDSVVVPLTSFLQAYRLSPGNGKIAPLAKLVPQLSVSGSGQMAYLNGFGDRVMFAAPDTAGLLKLFSADKLGDKWGEPYRLVGMGQSEEEIQDFPYMMADGVTLYYSAQGPESLGGYDIFVTRYNAATGQYVKAENVGMPFNSPSNDYLMVIDENARIGWFVTDRNQPADKVCVYCFIPNDTREVYDLSPETIDSVRRLAMIASVSESQTDPAVVSAAKTRLAGIQAAESADSKTSSLRLVINDDKVYTSYSQFRNAVARNLAKKAVAQQDELVETQKRLDEMRDKYATQRRRSETSEIQRLEQLAAQLQTDVKSTLKAMRRAELGE